MNIEQKLLDIKTYSEEGYRPVIDYDSWRVAVLNYCDELLPENITKFQRHDETDEVFVLLKGSCILFIGEGDEEIEEIHAQSMEPLKLYNVKKSVWHSHSLSQEAMVLIVENRDTTDANSPEIKLNRKQRNQLIRLADELFK
ncbi:hypothetical protein I0Q91_04145 [Halanaerobiaceae bacterium Z-7014]|uniref:Uncharacterized protein n=1 Tax=Halonatronomonas betaini TaxID=2778430 RepID=A0A931AT07_9FIRM|nr:hypothetical protein [Halonatronomonas betaini]MBF8436260.1 hypothetical protein [Halonatronomonas betaini]